MQKQANTDYRPEYTEALVMFGHLKLTPKGEQYADAWLMGWVNKRDKTESEGDKLIADYPYCNEAFAIRKYGIGVVFCPTGKWANDNARLIAREAAIKAIGQMQAIGLLI